MIYKTLPEYLKEHFADIKLSNEVEKVTTIEKLEQSWNFKETHSFVAKLAQYDDFTDAEAKRIIHAILNNKQIYWVLGDEDILSFGEKILDYAKSEETKELASELEAAVDDIKDA